MGQRQENLPPGPQLPEEGFAPPVGAVVGKSLRTIPPPQAGQGGGVSAALWVNSSKRILQSGHWYSWMGMACVRSCYFLSEFLSFGCQLQLSGLGPQPCTPKRGNTTRTTTK